MASRDPERPNVLVILSDDQGPWALGASGNPEIHTPNLDRLAGRGALLENFFCTSPVCSPARASIMTGLMPSSHGVHDHVREGNTGPDAVEYLQGYRTYVAALSRAGYECGLSGKWHLGASDRRPMGFDHWYALASGMSDYHDAEMYRGSELERSDRYVTDRIADDALAFLDRSLQNERPFCLNVHFTAPHSPWVGQHPPEFVNLYSDTSFESCPQEPFHPWGPADPHPDMQAAIEDPRSSLMGYFAAVSAMDARIGDLLDFLYRSHLERSTLVVFLSDNGFNCGHHGIWGKGNATFPMNVYEESVKVPAIASLPGVIAAPRRVPALLSGYDVLPTILDFCGVQREETSALPGRSMRALLTAQDADDGHQYVVVHSEYGPVRMIRTPRWKYVHRYPYGPNELYDLVEDPREDHNRVDDRACTGTVAELRYELERWFTSHSRPGADGTRTAVTGQGQRGLVGEPGGGREPFYPPASTHGFPVVDLKRFTAEG